MWAQRFLCHHHAGPAGGGHIVALGSLRHRRRHGRRPSRGGPVRAVVLAGLLALACDPWGDLRDGLDSDSQARFDRGRRLATPCLSCHDLTSDAVKIGPGLAGLVGRRAGSSPGFPYSPSMRDAGITWSEASLDAFLAGGQRLIPGNRMVSPDVSDRGKRADLVFFLMLVTDRPPASP